MMSVQELFYGEAEPVWIVNTTAAQVIRHYPQQKPDQYITDQRNFPQPKSQQQNQFQQFASHGDSSSQMGHSYQLLQQSSPRQRLLHDSPQHKQRNVYQKTVSYQPADHDHQYIQHNQRASLQQSTGESQSLRNARDTALEIESSNVLRSMCRTGCGFVVGTERGAQCGL
ncbi:unnamed protein product [Calypogeia fissa]